MGKFIDLTGQRFGRLVVIEREGSDKHGESTWYCKCDCGRTTVVTATRLRSGHTQSCGCILKENLSKRASERNYVHGLSRTRLYPIWYSMKARCYNPNRKNYKNYGGRGITVCDKWLHDFQAFYDWAMANGYDENAPRGKCTIDRINVDGNYEPNNCRWVDTKVQNENKRAPNGLKVKDT